MKQSSVSKHLRRFGPSLLAGAFAVTLFSVPAAAVRADDKTVTVGYMGVGGVQQTADGDYTGYVVEYLEAISKYTGWEYEYVYGSWAEMLDMLESGKVDLV